MAAPARSIGFDEIVGGTSTKEGSREGTWEVRTAGAGPAGKLPLTAEMLLERPSGDIFGLTQNAGMGWDPRELGRPQFLILSTRSSIPQNNTMGSTSSNWPRSSNVAALKSRCICTTMAIRRQTCDALSCSSPAVFVHGTGC